MWLIDVDTRKLVSFMDDRRVIDKYAILSHTWSDGEVTFADFHTKKATKLKGYKKIDLTCSQAKKDGLKYAWVDTCCINKDSSAELSEAINSMWRWYQNSKICYIWLEDTRFDDLTFPSYRRESPERLVSLLRGCRWISRGWTLQELLAPRARRFYDHEWVRFDTIVGFDNWHLENALEGTTGIQNQFITNPEILEEAPLALRLSWASRRNTTRVEDEAYCLLGLLGISMPLLYGEGNKAFIRLQEEIYRQSTDMSILFWHPYTQKQVGMLFAPDVFCFRLVNDEERGIDSWHYEWIVDSPGDNIITSRGLKTCLSLTKANDQDDYSYIVEPASGRYLKFHERQSHSSSRNTMGNLSRHLSVIRGDSEVERKHGKFGPMLDADPVTTDMTISRHAQNTLIFEIDDGLAVTGCDGLQLVDGQSVYHVPPQWQLRLRLQHPWSTATASLSVHLGNPYTFWENEPRNDGLLFTDFRERGMLIARHFDHRYHPDAYRNKIPAGTIIICVGKVEPGTELYHIHSSVEQQRGELAHRSNKQQRARMAACLKELDEAIERYFDHARFQRSLDKIITIKHPEERPFETQSADTVSAKVASHVPANAQEPAGEANGANAAADIEGSPMQLSD